VLTTDRTQQASSTLLPISIPSLAALQPGASIFVGQYLFTGSETSSAYLTVQQVSGRRRRPPGAPALPPAAHPQHPRRTPELTHTHTPAPRTLQINGNTAVCAVNNSCSLEGIQLTVHISNMKYEGPILSTDDVENIKTWGKANNIDFLSVSFCRSAADVAEVRQLLDR
jgi:pyruvate kinase